MNYKVVRTETADAQIRKIILYVAENFGREVALEKLEELERNLLDLGKYPQKCVELRYLVLKRQGYKVLVLEKNLVFYKINEEKQEAIIYAVVDHRPDYLNIIRDCKIQYNILQRESEKYFRFWVGASCGSYAKNLFHGYA